jgi:hypothetical protein
MDLLIKRRIGIRGAGLRCVLAWFRFGLAAALLVCCLPLLRAQEPRQESPEYLVKAVFLLNFTRFMEWPEEAFPSTDAPATICVFGRDPFGSALDRTLEGEMVRNRRVVARRISHVPPAKACQVLFVSSTAGGVRKLLEDVGPGVLTVSDRPNFLKEGGMIQLAIDDHRVRFDISPAAASAAKLQLSSQLMSVARSIQ